MTMKIQFLRVMAAVGCLTLMACQSCARRELNPETLVPPLLKLTAATEGVLRFGDTNALVSGPLLLAEAMKGKPELQEAFQRMRFEVRYDTRNVVILVSPQRGHVAWLEDASWTPLFVDKAHYLSNPPSPAQFTLPLP